MNQKVIQAAHIYILLILYTGFIVHVLSIPILLSVAKRDAWVCTLASTVPILIWILFIFYLYKKLNNHDIYTYLQHFYSKWISYIFSALFFVYFFSSALLTLKFTLFWASANYTFDVPNYVIVFLFCLICYYASAKGIVTIMTMAALLLPFVILFGLVVGVGNVPNKNYAQLFPIFEHGTKGFWIGTLYSCSSLFEVFYILFLSSHLKNKLKLRWLLIIGLFLVGLSFGPLAAAIAEFGPVEAEKMRNPAYEEWKLLTIGVHITRLDFLSIYQWLSGAFIRISLALFIAAKGFTVTKERKWVMPVLYLLLFIAANLHWSSASFIDYIEHIYFPIRLGFEVGVMLLLFLFIMLKGDKTW